MNRQPLWSNDPKVLCYAGILDRYLKKLSPGQTRLFCYEATDGQKKNYKSLGWPEAQMSSTQPIGVNSINAMFKEGAKLLGLKDPEEFGGHGLRRFFLSKLYNNPEVSNVEAMSAARHNSVAASITYIERNTESEAGRFRALGAPRLDSKIPSFGGFYGNPYRRSHDHDGQPGNVAATPHFQPQYDYQIMHPPQYNCGGNRYF